MHLLGLGWDRVFLLVVHSALPNPGGGINIVVEWIITLNYNSITDGVYMLLEKVV